MIGQFNKFFNTGTLLLEYSEPFVNKFAAKLAAQTNLPDNLEHYKTFIRFFDTIRNTNDFRSYVRDNPNIFSRNNKAITDAGNIEMFNAAQLEHIFDQFSTEAQQKKETHEVQQSIAPDTDLKFPASPDKTIRQINPTAGADDRYLEIYYAGNQEKCTHFSHDMFGQSYNFCIGRKDSSNMYSGYRLRDPQGKGRAAARSFYFIRDYSRPMTDELHLMVIHAVADGTYEYTLAPNNGDTAVDDFSEIVAKQPKLAKHKDIFKYVGFTEKEEDDRLLKGINPDSFQSLNPRHRRIYLSSGKHIPWRFFTQLTTEEQNLYLQACIAMHSTDNITYSPNTTTHAQEMQVIKACVAKHPEWGVDFIVQSTEHIRFNQDYHSRYRLSSVLSPLLLLKFNTKYYIDNNFQAIPRKDERLQPLKYFINKYILAKNVIDASQASALFNIKYKRIGHVASLVYSALTGQEENTHRIDNYGVIEARDAYYMIANVDFAPRFLAFDKNFSLTHKPAAISAVCREGFIIKEYEMSEEAKLATFTEDGTLSVTPISPEQLANYSTNNNFIGTYEFADFMALPKEMQKRIAIKYIKAYANKQLYVSNRHMATDIFIEESYQDVQQREDYIYKNMRANSDSKFVKAGLIDRRYNSPIPQYVPQFALTYFICRDLGEEVFNLYKQVLHPKILEALREYFSDQAGRWSSYTLMNDRNIMYVFSNSSKESSLIDLNDFTMKAFLPHIIDTKNHYVLGEVKRGVPKVLLAINKETFEIAPKEVVAKVQDTFDRIGKLKGAQLADTLFTTFLKYNSNPSALLGTASKTDTRLESNTYMPPFDSRAKITLSKSATLKVATREDSQLQAKYLNILMSNAADKISLKTLLNICKKHGNIDLAAVFIKFIKSYGSTAEVSMGYLFLPRDVSVEQALQSKVQTSMFIELKNTIVVPEGVNHELLVGWRGRDQIHLGQSRKEAFSENSLVSNKQMVYVRNVPNIIKGKTTGLHTVLSLIKNATDTRKAIKAYQALQQVVRIDSGSSNRILEDLYNSAIAAKRAPAIQEEKLPFGLYYKLVS